MVTDVLFWAFVGLGSVKAYWVVRPDRHANPLPWELLAIAIVWISAFFVGAALLIE